MRARGGWTVKTEGNQWPHIARRRHLHHCLRRRAASNHDGDVIDGVSSKATECGLHRGATWTGVALVSHNREIDPQHAICDFSEELVTSHTAQLIDEDGICRQESSWHNPWYSVPEVGKRFKGRKQVEFKLLVRLRRIFWKAPSAHFLWSHNKTTVGPSCHLVSPSK